MLALALFTAAVSGVSLAWPPTRRPVDLPDEPAEEEVVEEPPAPSPSGAAPRALREVARPAVVPAPASQPLGGAVIGGSIMGLLKGLFGVGGAFLIVPVMSRFGRVRREVAVGSSLFAILVASLVAAVRHATLGNVDASDLLALVPGGLFGSFVGARAAKSMSPASIRRVFLVVMLASTVYLVLFRSAYQ